MSVKKKGDIYHKIGNFIYSISYLLAKIAWYFIRIGDRRNV